MTTPKMSASAAAAAATAQRTQEFCVRWNSHLGSIGAAFPQLLAGQRFVDVTLACEGHQVHCHRLVLAACSSYFESILAENPCKHPVIILPSEIKLWEIQALVDFMYKGEVNVTQAGLPQLLHCAEQLRIRGLYGSDAALNLHQLKALSSKATAAAMDTAAAADETAKNSTTTTTTTTNNNSNSNINLTTAKTRMLLQQQQQMNQQQFAVNKEAQQQHHQQSLHTNGATNALQQTHQLQLLQLQQQHKLQHQQQQQQQQMERQSAAANAMLMSGSHSNAPTEDDSADDSTSNAYDQYEPPSATAAPAAAAAVSAAGFTSSSTHLLLDTTIEDDHNYVAAHDADASVDDGDLGDDSLTEQDSSANSSLLLATAASMSDQSASFKRVRRSEASLAQAAKCVSKGQTFQTVSNMFNIPVSTIRFYMARKGILPKRKRGRGASTASGGIMSQSMQIKLEPHYDLDGGDGDAEANNYKLNETG